MALRAVKHKFTGATVAISSYDATKTSLGTLMVQRTGSNPQDKFVGPLPIGMTTPMQEVVETVGTVAASTTNVTGTGTNFTASMVNMSIGFGSTNPAQVTAWYNIATRVAASGANCITLSTSAGTIDAGTPYVVVTAIPMMYPHVITYSSTIDWVFLTENLATATTARRIFLYQYNKTTSVYTWVGFINVTLISGANANTTRGFRALRYLHTNGTVDTNGTTTVTGHSTTWSTDRVAIGARIGFGSTDPTQISTWYVIGAAVSSDGSLTLADATGLGTKNGVSYVIEELRFALTVTQATAPTNGGLFLVKGVNYGDFVPTGTTIPAATNADGIKALYWLADNVTTETNVGACGCAIQSEVSKSLHYAYVLDGTAGANVPMKCFRYNLRAIGAVSGGKMTLSLAYTTAGTVTVSGVNVTGSSTSFGATMVGRNIGFGSTSPAQITTWYTIATCGGASAITLTTSGPTISSPSNYIIDTADVIATANVNVNGNITNINNGRVGTLNHGPGAGEESLYFVTVSRIYRAAISKIFAGNLGWISDDRPEIPPGSASTYPATGALNCVEIADAMDRLIVMSTSATAFRHYMTRYPQNAGDAFDNIWGIDDKQQDQLWALGNAYISSGTAACSTTTVTGTNTFFTSAMVGFQIGFGYTDPTLISTWYTISGWTSVTSITISTSAGTFGAGPYVINLNSNTVPHFNTASQIVSVWSQNGISHLVKHGPTATLCQMYALPLSADWSCAATTNQRVITPVLYTPDCASFYWVMISDDDYRGAGEFSVPPEPYRVYFRTKNIEDNTGAWTLVGANGDLSGLAGARRIQFMFEFQTVGWTCVPAKIMGLTVVYDDNVTTTDSHFQPSAALSSVANKQFTWRFAVAFGGSGTPTLRARLYNAVTGDLLLDEYSVSANGVWEKTTDGGSSWALLSFDPSGDKGNETTYIRYTPEALGDNIKVRAILTQ